MDAGRSAGARRSDDGRRERTCGAGTRHMRRQLELTLELVSVLPSAGARSSSKFDVVWSGLWPCCDGRTGFNLSQFPVLQLGRLALFDSTLGAVQRDDRPCGFAADG